MNILKTTIFQVVMVLVFALVAAGQDYEYGKPVELKGLSKVYIDAGDDPESFERIKNAFEKTLPELKIVESSDEADFIVSFRSSRESVTIGRTSDMKNAGRGYIAIPSPGKKRLRVLLKFESIEDTWGEQKPATKFARKVISEYKKANGLK
jgi:hypothetical protein